MRISPYILLLCISISCLSCNRKKNKMELASLSNAREVPVSYAEGLDIKDYGAFMVVTVKNPWPNAEKSFRYLLEKEKAVIPSDLEFDQRVKIPVEKIVVTSTTHIPSLEVLNVEESLVGFPGLDLISSPRTRKRIAKGEIRELGTNEQLNTENLLALQPDVVVSFSINGSNNSLRTIQKSGIPVLLNSDWTAHSPLGKAEWIKFFGALFGKLPEATSFFNKIEKEYYAAKELASHADSWPTVIAGAMYRDQWFLPAGNSWQAQFLKDAHADYLFAQSEGTGSLSLSLEKVIAKGSDASFWIGPAAFGTYEELKEASLHYTRFKAFKNNKVYTYSSQKGETGGVIFYEKAPNRPDLVLKDLIHILHPGMLPDYEPVFYKPLK